MSHNKKYISHPDPIYTYITIKSRNHTFNNLTARPVRGKISIDMLNTTQVSKLNMVRKFMATRKINKVRVHNF